MNENDCEPNQTESPATSLPTICHDGRCCEGINRREFVALGTAMITGAAATATHTLPTMAGPFETNEYLEAIPADKKLAADWVASLFARGEKEIYTDHVALRRIGMPVGGLFAGTVYLAGDGRLWLWDIFNRDQNGILPRNGALPEGIGVGGNNNMRGLNYLSPAPLTQPFKVGFALKINDVDAPARLDRFSSKSVSTAAIRSAVSAIVTTTVQRRYTWRLFHRSFRSTSTTHPCRRR